jgi:hypothetical protein
MMTHFWLFQGILGLLLVVAILAACTPMITAFRSSSGKR